MFQVESFFAAVKNRICGTKHDISSALIKASPSKGSIRMTFQKFSLFGFQVYIDDYQGSNDIAHMLHGAGIFTKKNWVILFGQMLVNIPYMEHMGCRNHFKFSNLTKVLKFLFSQASYRDGIICGSCLTTLASSAVTQNMVDKLE